MLPKSQSQLRRRHHLRRPEDPPPPLIPLSLPSRPWAAWCDRSDTNHPLEGLCARINRGGRAPDRGAPLRMVRLAVPMVLV